MEKTILLSFAPGNVGGDFYKKLYTQFVTFTPNKFSIKKNGRNWSVRDWKEKHVQEIEGAGYGDSLSASYNQSLFMITQIYSPNPFCSIRISQENLLVDSMALETVLKKEGFVSAYVFDTVYEEVQNTVFESNILGMGYNLDSIEDTPFTVDPYTNIKEYDISHNPGRSILLGHTWIVAAWKMWFGPSFYKLVPKRRLLGFPYAYKVEELEGDKVSIQLFEKIEESSTAENRNRQQAWLDWIDIEQLSKRYP